MPEKSPNSELAAPAGEWRKPVRGERYEHSAAGWAGGTRPTAGESPSPYLSRGIEKRIYETVY